jgi:hypothetical protein
MCQIGFSTETKQRIYVFRVVLEISGDLLPYPVLINGDVYFYYGKKEYWFLYI